jgi:hypothetical protein
MTRRRLQRLAMEWTVALTNSDIPAELRRLSPAVDGGLGDLRFRALLADDDWHSLPPAVRRRFSKRLAGGRTMIYVGEVLETRMSRFGWCLAQVARLLGGPLPTSCDAHMLSVVTVTEDMATGGQVWTRLYARCSGFPQIIHSSKRFSGLTGLEEYLGGGLSIALRIRVRGGALAFCSDGYFLRIFGTRWRVPDWLSPGTMTVTHAECGDGRFEFRLEVSHPRFGMLVRQVAAFREAGPWTCNGSGFDPQLASRSFTAPSRSTETSCDTPRSAMVTP